MSAPEASSRRPGPGAQPPGSAEGQSGGGGECAQAQAMVGGQDPMSVGWACGEKVSTREPVGEMKRSLHERRQTRQGWVLRVPNDSVPELSYTPPPPWPLPTDFPTSPNAKLHTRHLTTGSRFLHGQPSA